MKDCKRCGEVKPLELFSPAKRGPFRRSSFCKSCTAAYAAKKRAADPEKARAMAHANYLKNKSLVLDRSREYRQTHPGYQSVNRRKRVAADPIREKNQRREHAARRRARKYDAVILPVRQEFVIERDRSICWICSKAVDDKQMSLDHVIPLSKGGAHSEDNLRVAHRRCNSRRQMMDMQREIREQRQAAS